MLQQQMTTLKSRYFRIQLVKQNNRVEYRILGSDGQHYYRVQMCNGRAINCCDHEGNKCQARHFRPGVPCTHMSQATELERLHRERAKAEKTVASMPEQVKSVVEQEVQKCLVLRERQVAAQVKRPETAEDWKALVRRQKDADRAFARQYRQSARVIREAQEVA